MNQQAPRIKTTISFRNRSLTESARRTQAQRLLSASLLLAGLWWVSSEARAAVEFGQPSVQSQQGQKLRVAIPYSKNPGENVSINRFSVDSVTLADGRVLDGKRFVLMAPLHRNIIVLQSPDNVYSPSIKLAMKISNQAQAAASFDLTVPAFRAAASEAQPVVVKKKPLKRKPVKKVRAKKTAGKSYKPAVKPVSVVPVPEGTGAGTRPSFSAPAAPAAPVAAPAAAPKAAAPGASAGSKGQPAVQPGK